MKNVIFTKAPLKNRREMSAWSFLARQRSGLLMIFLLLLALTIYKEFEGRGEERVLDVTENKGGSAVKRIFEGEVINEFGGKPGKLTTDFKMVKGEESDGEEGDAVHKVGKTQPRCHFRAPTENR